MCIQLKHRLDARAKHRLCELVPDGTTLPLCTVETNGEPFPEERRYWPGVFPKAMWTNDVHIEYHESTCTWLLKRRDQDGVGLRFHFLKNVDHWAVRVLAQDLGLFREDGRTPA